MAANLSGEAIPAVLSDLISADIAGLDDQSRQVLGIAATIGRDITHGLLKQVADLDDQAIERAVRAAIEAQLMVVDADTDTYRFRHPLIGEVVYRELLPSERTRWHGRVAETPPRSQPRPWPGPTLPVSSPSTWTEPVIRPGRSSPSWPRPTWPKRSLLPPHYGIWNGPSSSGTTSVTPPGGTPR